MPAVVVSNLDLRLSAGKGGFVETVLEVVVVQYSGAKIDLAKLFKIVDGHQKRTCRRREADTLAWEEERSHQER